MISFNEIPAGIKVPGVYVEFDNSMAMQGATLQDYRALVCGQMLDSGEGEALRAYTVTSAEEAEKLFGKGSMAALMTAAFLKNNNYTHLTVMALADDPESVAASGTLTFGGSATSSAPVMLYIAGRAVRCPVASGDAAVTIAAAAAAAVNADESLPVRAGVEAAVVTLTAKNKGLAGNSIDLRVGYYDEIMPAGVTVQIKAMNAGAGAPDLTAFIEALGDEWFHVIAWPWADRASLAVLDTELTGRWGPMRHIDGVAFCGIGGTFAEVEAFGSGEGAGNYAHTCLVESVASPDWPCCRAASAAALVAYYGNIDPARPFQTLTLKGCLAPERADRLTMQQQNLLLSAGIATTAVDAGGRVTVQRLVTNYLKTAAGAPDTSYQDVNSLLTLSYLRFDFRARIARKYPRHKLADDSSRLPAGQAIMTPSIGKAEAVAAFQDWEALGLVENLAAFKAAMICERDERDVNRLNWLLTPDLVNQFRVAAVNIQFRL